MKRTGRGRGGGGAGGAVHACIKKNVLTIHIVVEHLFT